MQSTCNVNNKNVNLNLPEDLLITTGTQNIWLGANDLVSEGNFVWDHDNQALTYTDWLNNQPNNGFPTAPEQNCVAYIHVASNAIARQWHDWQCDHSFRFMCESN